MKTTLRALAVLAVICACGTASAGIPNEELMCLEPHGELDRFRYLRSAALDITGTVPPAEWNSELVELEDVPEAWIDELLDSPELPSALFDGIGP